MKLLLVLLLSSCTFTLRPKSNQAQIAAIVTDATLFSAGCIFGMNELNKPGPPYSTPRDERLMYGGFALMFGTWLSYWFRR